MYTLLNPPVGEGNDGVLRINGVAHEKYLHKNGVETNEKGSGGSRNGVGPHQNGNGVVKPDVQGQTISDGEERGSKFLDVVLEGAKVPLDTSVPLDSRPPWADDELLRKGRAFAMRYLFGLVDAEMLSLAILFSFRGGLQPLIFTGRSTTPYTAFVRYLSTVTRVVSWYESDVFEEGSEAHKNMSVVRGLHASVSKAMNEEASGGELESRVTLEGRETGMWSTYLDDLKEDFRDATTVGGSGCPFAEISSLARKEEVKSSGVPFVNQLDLSLTQFGFVALCVLYPEKFGVHGASEDDFKGFVHLWRCLGHLLGIKDRYNMCSSDDLDETRDRFRAVIEKWAKPGLKDVTPEWEHMFRCVVEGVNYYVPGNRFGTSMAYLFWVLDIPSANLTSRMTWTETILYYSHRLVLNHMFKMSWYLRFSNYMLDRSLAWARNPPEGWMRKIKEKEYDFQKNTTTRVVASR